jgi:hypothetical protein
VCVPQTPNREQLLTGKRTEKATVDLWGEVGTKLKVNVDKMAGL